MKSRRPQINTVKTLQEICIQGQVREFTGLGNHYYHLETVLHIDGFKFNMIYLALQIPKDTRFNFCALTEQHKSQFRTWLTGMSGEGPQSYMQEGCATRLQLSTHQSPTTLNLIPGHCRKGHQDQCTETSTPDCPVDSLLPLFQQWVQQRISHSSTRLI